MPGRLLLGAAILLGLGSGLQAQTRADSAAIVLESARLLAAAGREDAARALYRQITARFAGTPAAGTADSLLGALARALEPRGAGRTGYVLFHTLFGGFLGAAIPAALDAEGTEPYGAGLLIGAPLGFFASRAFARSRISSPGQAGIASFAAVWGTWQGLLVQEMLALSEGQRCDESGCRQAGERAPWIAMVAGGVAGLTAGTMLARRSIASGEASVVSHSASWGTWLGFATGILTGAEDEGLSVAMVIGGNAGLLAAIPAARAWQPSSSRVRLITAAGVGGGLAGVGLSLLLGTDSPEGAVAPPLTGSLAGLVAGTLLTRGRDDPDQPSPPSLALLRLGAGAPRAELPLPLPSLLPSGSRRGPAFRPGFRILLLEARF
jgi:hypothetical protein